jgi:nitrite reductase (NADH) large subunit
LASLAAAILSAVVFAGPILIVKVLHPRSRLAMLGDDYFLKQASGYALITLAVVSLMLSLRKRWKRFAFSDVPIFRMIHGLIGALTMLVLALHTGLQLGQPRQLSAVLMDGPRMVTALTVDFVAVVLLGGFAGMITARSSRWNPVTALTQRRRWSFVHLAFCWPLPVLVILHIIQVYFY